MTTRDGSSATSTIIEFQLRKRRCASKLKKRESILAIHPIRQIYSLRGVKYHTVHKLHERARAIVDREVFAELHTIKLQKQRSDCN